MPLSLQDAVSALKSDGPALTSGVSELCGQVQRLEGRVDAYGLSLTATQTALAQEQEKLVAASRTLAEGLVAARAALAREVSDTDAAVLDLTRYLALMEGELQAQMALAGQKLHNLKGQLDTLPPVMQQAVQQQQQVLQKTQGAVDDAVGRLKGTVGKTVAQYDGLKTQLRTNSEQVGQSVGVLLAHVTEAQTRTAEHADTLAKNSETISATFGSNVQSTFQNVVGQPGEQLKSGIDTLSGHAQREIDAGLTHLLNQGIKRVLNGLEKISSRNQSIINDLRRLVPEEVSEGLRLLGWVLQNLDLIVKKLTRRAVNWFVDMVSGGVEWLSQKTGINLDFIKQGVQALGNVVIAGVDLAAGQYRLVKTVLTNPGQIGAEIGNLVSDATHYAGAVGKLVGI